MIINSHFTTNGSPALLLSPIIFIWEVVPGNPITYVSVVTGHPMSNPTGDGFYSYEFATRDATKNYLVRVDGGLAQPQGERFSVSAIPADDTVSVAMPFSVQDIVDGVLDEPSAAHLQPGSVGLHLNEVHADVQQLRVDVTTALSVVNTLIKYERNRTKIDKVAMTLTVYNDDGVTPLKVFNLRDSTGAPSVTEVCERVPV